MQLREFQDQINSLFSHKDKKRGMGGTFMYFMEEVGELAEALREPEKHDLEGEFADCVAWLTSLANLAGVDLQKAVTEKYPNKCPVCSKNPCICTNKS